MTYLALGHSFDISSEDSGLLADAGDLLSSLTRSQDRPSMVYDLRHGVGDAAVLSALIGNVTFAAIKRAEGELLLHAGAVSRPDGSTMVICAPSGRGKSTLTSRLTQAGHAYVTDETVCLEPHTLRITPFRKPLSIKPGSQALFPGLRPDWATDDEAWLLAPQMLDGPALPPGPLLPELVVFPSYRAGASVEVERLSPGEAAYLMGQESSRLRHVHGGPLQALARVARRAPAYRVVHGNVDRAADAVTDLWDAA